MKIVKRLVLLLFAILAAAVFAVAIPFSSVWDKGKPQVDGTLHAPGLLAPVRVVRDNYGVPHIFAETDRDAYFALGYLHTQDRLWQMDVFRRMAEGRMSEVFGNLPRKNPSNPARTMLEQDIFYRALGLRHMWEIKRHDDIPPQTRRLLEGYVAGVNAGILAAGDNLPPEFRLLMYGPTPWDIEAVGAMGRLISWGLGGNMPGELLRYEAVARLGRADGWKLVGRHSDPGPYIIPPDVKKYDPHGKTIPVDPWYLPPELTKASFFKGTAVRTLAVDETKRLADMIPEFMPPTFAESSNNWVVAGWRSASGKPILCNDPHLPHMTPSIFYEAHLTSREGLDVIGVTFPGMPFVALGHNRRVAWAATTTHADVQDLFVEMVDPKNPNNYIFKGRSRPFGVRTEQIRVRALRGPDKIVTVKIRSTVHGPVINQAVPYLSKSAPPMALQWAAWYGGYRDLGAFFSIARSDNVAEISAAIGSFIAPIQNWVFADVNGRIGYFPGGAVPIRRSGDGTIPVPGWTGKFEWTGMIPLAQLPQVYDPKNGYIVSANNKVVPEADYPYHYSYEYNNYRAAHIENMLTSRNKWTTRRMRALQMDNVTEQGRRIAPLFIQACRAKCDPRDPLLRDALSALESWNFKTDIRNVGPTIFATAYQNAIKEVYADEFPPEFFNRVVNEWSFDPRFDNALEDESYPFFDDRRTPGVESREDILARAFAVTVKQLGVSMGQNVAGWRWGLAHVARFEHPLGAVPPIGGIVNPQPFAAAGARGTVNNSHYDLYNKFKPDYGPVFRQIIDMAHPEDAVMIIDMGQSGIPKTPHYLDQLPLWRAGKYIPMLMDPAAIEEHAESVLNLLPVK